MKEQEVKELGELLKSHQKLISWAIPELNTVFTLGMTLSSSDRRDVAYMGEVIAKILREVLTTFYQAVPTERRLKDSKPDDIPL